MEVEKINVKSWLDQATGKAAKKSADSNSGSIAYFTKLDKQHPIRLINALPPLTESEKRSGIGQARFFNMAWIKDDNDKKMFLVYPSAYSDRTEPQHPMLGFVNKVLSYKLVRFKGQTKSAKNYYYANDDTNSVEIDGHSYTLKSIFSNVLTGGETPTGNTKPKGWFGVERYVGQGIDRETGKPAIVAARLSASSKPTYFAKMTIWNELLSTVSSNGDPSDYDVLFDYSKEDEADQFPTLHILNASNLKAMGRLTPDVDKLTSDLPLTTADSSVELYDLDKLLQTKMEEILRRLPRTIKAFDKLAGTNFWNEMNDYAKTVEGYVPGKKAEKAVTTDEASEPAIESEVEKAPEAPAKPIAQPVETVAQPVAVKPAEPKPAAATAPSKEPAMTMCFQCGAIYDLNTHDCCPECGAKA